MPNWVDLQIDQPGTLRALARLGHALPAAPTRICHWSPYLRPGVFAIYRAALNGSLTLPILRAALPARADRRWSRLLLANARLPFVSDPA